MILQVLADEGVVNDVGYAFRLEQGFVADA